VPGAQVARLPQAAAPRPSLKSKRSRRCFVKHARRVRGNHAAFRAGVHVNVVVADGDVRGDAQFRRDTEKFVVHLFCEQQTGLPCLLLGAHFLARRPFVVGPILHVACGVQDLSGFVEHWVGATLSVWPCTPLTILVSYTRQHGSPESGIASPPRRRDDRFLRG